MGNKFICTQNLVIEILSIDAAKESFDFSSAGLILEALFPDFIGMEKKKRLPDHYLIFYTCFFFFLKICVLVKVTESAVRENDTALLFTAQSAVIQEMHSEK